MPYSFPESGEVAHDKPLEQLSDEEVLEEIGDTAGHPEFPVLLGVYLLEEAEAFGAFPDPASDTVPELRNWGEPYRLRERRSLPGSVRSTAGRAKTCP